MDASETCAADEDEVCGGGAASGLARRSVIVHFGRLGADHETLASGREEK
jgi:hypothetical protein